MHAPGADFSSAQDFAALERAISKGIAFAFVKATEGATYANPLFASQCGRLGQHEVIVGAYHFLAHDVDGAAQWDHFEHTLGPHFRGPVACDQETDRGVLVPDAVAHAFIRRGHQRGFKVGRYGDSRVIGRNLGEDWKWSASWTSRPPAGPWAVWQFSDGGGKQDWNVFNGTRAELSLWARRMGTRRVAKPVRWWLHDDFRQVARGPYRLPQLAAVLVGYLTRNPRTYALRLVRK